MTIVLVLCSAFGMICGVLLGTFLFANPLSGIGIGMALGAGMAGVMIALAQEMEPAPGGV